MLPRDARCLPACRLSIVLMGLACWVLAASGLAQESKAGAAQALSVPTPAKSLSNYFQPMPIIGSLAKDAWGAPEVLPRDPRNGLEDSTLKQWCYWDGQIIKAPDGKYHMFASRWDQARGHNGWFGSVAVHTVSDNLFGPYLDKGMCWPDNQGGKGHNVTALVMPDGRYAVVVSETRPGDVFVSKSLDGPWEHLGQLKVDANGFNPRDGGMSNVSIMVRPDGDYMIVPRSGAIWLSKDGILGPYKIQGPPIYPKIKDLPTLENLEDPVVWYSGGLYHIVVNSWSNRKAFHLTSGDGINDWTYQGIAYDPTTDFLRYTDGTVNHWNKIERPGVYIEDGHVKAFTFAPIDVEKDQERGNDTHGSKVLVVPFDGAALDRDLQSARNRQPVSAPAESTTSPVAQPAQPRREMDTTSRTLNLSEIRMRDVCILPDPASKTYYMVGSGFGSVRTYTSQDLKTWQGPKIIFTPPSDIWGDIKTTGIWAPELHAYKGKYYLFLTFNTRNKLSEQWRNWERAGRVTRGSAILVSDSPTGPFKAFLNHSTPPTDMMTLDGTLWIEEGKPYMVFAHEWVQITNGTIEAIPLKDDLSEATGEPFKLFHASAAPWSKTDEKMGNNVTDGPFLHTSKSGKLFMVWASYGTGGYTEGIAISDSGKLAGPWRHQTEPLFKDNGGHAMLFTTFEGKLMMVLHAPNEKNTQPRIFEMEDTGETLKVVKEFKGTE